MIGIDTDFLVALELADHEQHKAVHRLLARHAKRGETFALCPQVVAEFIHVVTDRKRFALPMEMSVALRQAEIWSTAVDVKQYLPHENAVELFFHWMNQHRLGRKRVLDTMLAATYATEGVTKIATLNEDDFRVFGVFEFVSP
ncbi:MAG: type II toxin-antitoxin system VapC family toxin [Pirellulaceae bacterium]